MLQVLFDSMRELSAIVFVASGIIGMVVLPFYVLYHILNIMYKQGLIFKNVFKYMRHRKQFYKWLESQKATKIKTVRKGKKQEGEE